MSCLRSTASTESAAICLRALGWPWGHRVSGARGRSGTLRSPFQPITRLWQFEGLSVKHGPSDRFAPGAVIQELISFCVKPYQSSTDSIYALSVRELTPPLLAFPLSTRSRQAA